MCEESTMIAIALFLILLGFWVFLLTQPRLARLTAPWRRRRRLHRLSARFAEAIEYGLFAAADGYARDWLNVAQEHKPARPAPHPSKPSPSTQRDAL
jgi:hypothetical protein